MNRFSRAIRAFTGKTQKKSTTAVRKIVLDMFSGVIQLSPVDEGRFKGNWQPAVGSAPGGELELKDPSGAVVTAKVQGTVAGIRAGDVIYMVNNLPYAQELEEGSSRQAPNGMVALTVQRFQPVAAAVGVELNRI